MNNGFLTWLYFGLFAIVWIKSITVGSEFDFIQWWKYGKAYTRWYFNREDWLHYRVKHPTPTREEQRVMNEEE